MLLTLPYYVDDALFYMKDAYAQPVHVTLYQTGLAAVVVEKRFKEFSNF